MYEYKDKEYPTGLEEAIEATDRVHSVLTANDEYRLAIVELPDGKQRTELVGTKNKDNFIFNIETATNGANTVIKKPLTSKKLKFVKFFQPKDEVKKKEESLA
jgi:hypothetical protein